MLYTRFISSVNPAKSILLLCLLLLPVSVLAAEPASSSPSESTMTQRELAKKQVNSDEEDTNPQNREKKRFGLKVRRHDVEQRDVGIADEKNKQQTKDT